MRLDWLGSPDLSWRDLAVIVKCAPNDSVLAEVLDPDGQRHFTPQVDMWRNIEYYLAWLQWAKTSDAARNRNAPLPREFPWEARARKSRGQVGSRADVMDWDEAADFFGWSAEMRKWFSDN